MTTVDIKRIWAEKRLVVALIAGIAVVDVGLLVFGVLPLRERLEASDDEINSASQERRQQQIDLEESQKRIHIANRAREDLDQFYETVLPLNDRMARSILYQELGNRVSAERLVLERRLIKREEELNEVSRLSRLETTVRLSGAYSHIRQFIDSIETGDDFIIIENLTLAPTPDVDRNALVLTMRLSTYFLNGNY